MTTRDEVTFVVSMRELMDVRLSMAEVVQHYLRNKGIHISDMPTFRKGFWLVPPDWNLNLYFEHDRLYVHYYDVAARDRRYRAQKAQEEQKKQQEAEQETSKIRQSNIFGSLSKDDDEDTPSALLGKPD